MSTFFSAIKSYDRFVNNRWETIKVTSDEQLSLAMACENRIRFELNSKTVYAGLFPEPVKNSKKTPTYNFKIGAVGFNNGEEIVLHYGKSGAKMTHRQTVDKVSKDRLRNILAYKVENGYRSLAIQRGEIFTILTKSAVLEFVKGVQVEKLPEKPKEDQTKDHPPVGLPTSGALSVNCYDQGLYTWVKIDGHNTVESLPSKVFLSFKETFKTDLVHSAKRGDFYAKRLIAHQDILEFFAKLGYTVNAPTKDDSIPQPSTVTEEKPVQSVPVREFAERQPAINAPMTSDQKLAVLASGLAQLLAAIS